jgi:hypothetical protein
VFPEHVGKLPKQIHANGREPSATDAAEAVDADTDGFVAPLRNAKGVFLPGGLVHTSTHKQKKNYGKY